MAEKKFVMAGVMGWPVAHSRSPIIHSHWIRQYGLQGAYGLFAVQPDQVEAAVRGLRALGLAGSNVTIPHKVTAMQFMDVVDPLARRMGAINTIVVTPEGALQGFNNDGYGYIQSLRDAQADWQANTGPALVLGAGGAARAVVLSLLDQGATEIRLCNRTRTKAQELADEFGAGIQVVNWSERAEALHGVSLLANTTNLGMHGQPELDLRLDHLPPAALVSDAVYVPLETELLRAARLRGNKTVDGLGMLLNQARPAFRAWFGVMPDITPGLHQAVMATL